MLTAQDWEHLPYFIAIAQQGSFRAAATALNTSHVKVARHLDALEGAYGVALVRRSQRGVELTQAGEALLPLAQDAETSVLQARRSLQGLDQQMSGEIKFSTSDPLAYLLLGPILARFSEQYPLIDLNIHVATAFDDPRLLTTDVSLRMVYEVGQDALVRKLFPIGIGTYASRDYLEQALPTAGPSGEGLTWLGAATEGERPQWVLDTIFPAASLSHRFGHPLMHLELASQGLGMSRLAAFMTKDRPTLVRVPGTDIEEGPPLSIITHPEMKRVARVRRFVDFLDEELRKQRGLIQRGEVAAG